MNLDKAKEFRENALRLDRWISEDIERTRQAERIGYLVGSETTIWIDRRAKIGDGVFFGPGVEIRGTSKIGENVVIDSGTIIEDSDVGDESVVAPHMVLERVRVGKRARIGRSPLTDSSFGDDVRTGAFTEIVRSHLGNGVAAQHWSYLGDTTVGEGTNVGAGTVTANYDGRKKKKTKIGRNVFTGVNSSLVAKLEIGDETLIGAGTVVTRNVPQNTVVVGLDRILENTTFHKTKDGWRIRKRI